MAAALAITLAWPLTGRMGWGLFPSIPRDYSQAIVTMPVGTPLNTTLDVRDSMVAEAKQVVAENGGEQLGRGVYTLINGTRISLRAYLQPEGIRPLPTREFTNKWREAAGMLSTARSVRYESAFGGPGGGNGIEIRLSHSDVEVDP
jgi:hypothetical protein